MHKVLILTLGSILIVCTSLPSFADEIQKITIKTERSGWGHEMQTIVIVKSGDQFLRDGKQVEKSRVDFFFKSIQQPIVPKLNMGNLEIGKKWVQDNEADFLGDLSPAQKELLKKELKKTELVEKAVRAYYDSFWTDDTAHVEVNIHLSTRSIVLESFSQKSFMLPWAIIEGDKKKMTFDAGIARALADLLPPGSVNQDRMLGKNLAKRLGRSMAWRHLSNSLGMAKAKEDFGPDLKRLQKRYKIVKADSATMSGLGFDVSGLHASLSGESIPLGVELDIHLPGKGGKLKNLNSFMAKAPIYISLTSSVSWLSEWLEANPSSKIEINMVDDISLTDSAKGRLISDLKSHYPSLLAEIESSLKNSVLLTISEADNRYSRWVVLPDQRMLLWHATGTPVLKWSKENLPTSWESVGQDSYCVLVSPGGELIKIGNK